MVASRISLTGRFGRASERSIGVARRCFTSPINAVSERPPNYPSDSSFQRVPQPFAWWKRNLLSIRSHRLLHGAWEAMVFSGFPTTYQKVRRIKNKKCHGVVNSHSSLGYKYKGSLCPGLQSTRNLQSSPQHLAVSPSPSLHRRPPLSSPHRLPTVISQSTSSSPSPHRCRRIDAFPL